MDYNYECTTHEWVANEDGDLDFYFRANFLHPIDMYMGIGGTASNFGTSEDWTGQLYMESEYADPSKPSALKILDTDYDNYYVKYSCSSMLWDGMHWESWAIMSRETTLSSELYAAAEAAVYEHVPNTDINWFTKHETAHWWCRYDWDLA